MEQSVMKSKRHRGNNFTKEEELLLLSEVEKYKSVIECKMTDKINVSQKNEAWKKIISAFNAKNISNRSIEQMKIKYDNLKCKARKISAANKTYMKRTVGGPAGDTNVDPVIDAVLRIVNKTTVIGLQNPFDCDDSSITGDVNNENSFQEENNIIIIDSENLNFPSLQEESVVFDSSWANDVPIDIEEDNSKENKKLEPAEHTQATPAITPLKKNKISEKSINGNSWSKYTPKQLKFPMSKKLRPTVTNPVKDEYYKKKSN